MIYALGKVNRWFSTAFHRREMFNVRGLQFTVEQSPENEQRDPLTTRQRKKLDPEKPIMQINAPEYHFYTMHVQHKFTVL